MQIQVIKSTDSIRRVSRIKTNSSYGFTTPMPDMTVTPTNVFVQPAQDMDYEPNITVLIPIDNTFVTAVKTGPQRIVKMDAVSAYPPEIVSKYRPTGNHNSQSCLVCNPLHCKQCKLSVRHDMLNENGYCIYCREGINKAYPRIS